MTIRHEGLGQFLKGTFGNGGDNIFVDSKGTIRRIMDNDLNGNGVFDIALPNSHGYIERAPTYIYTQKKDGWEKTVLSHDSCWMTRAADVDGDGFLDLIVVNGENGVSSELESYVYWGGPKGLTGECTTFPTIGAYDAAVYDLNGNGRKDIIFSTSWYDHHNAGIPIYQKVFEQTSARTFKDVTEKYKLTGMATISLLCEDLDHDGYPEIVLANFREGYNSDTESFLYKGGAKGFETKTPVRLPTHFASQVVAEDLNNDGFKELIFTGGSQLMVYWNDSGDFRPDNRLVLDIEGTASQFMKGILPIDIADIDKDGILELVIGTLSGVEIRKADNLLRVSKKLPCYGCSGIKAVDIHNTGYRDILTSHYCSVKSYDTQSIVFWNSEGEFSIEHTTAFETNGPVGCNAADLDNDGIKEIIYCNTMRGPAQMDPEFPVFVYYGTADHRYLPENRREYPVNMMCHTYAAADVDNDGYVELLATGCDGIRIFKGTPDGPDPKDYYDVSHPASESVLVGGVLVGDFNHDGWIDLIMVPWIHEGSVEELEKSVYVCFGGPDGYSIERSMVLPAYVECAQSILLADINNDGYLDFIYGEGGGEGSLGVYYGGPKGFDRNHFGKIFLKDYNGATIMGIAAADVDKDGWLELFITTGGHYTRKASHIYVLKDGKHQFPAEKAFMFETGGTTGFPAFADMRKSGNLDLLLPFYSTSETRELPARIFYGDGKGNFDWANPLQIDCLASIAFCPVDLNGNGYPDLFICCHRNDLGHIVDSMLIMNGPDGLNIKNSQKILGYGPHSFTGKNQGNACDRGDKEYYTSPVFECSDPSRVEWEGETPFKTSLVFTVRFGRTLEETSASAWSEEITTSGSGINAPKGTKYMQYKIAFCAPGLVDSPKLTAVIIR